METATQDSLNSTKYKLNSDWILWAHFPHDTDWSVSSYKQVAEVNCAEAVIAINDLLPEKLVKNCMLFLMKKGIMPIWEDPANRDGGTFSYKVLNKDVPLAWKNLFYLVAGETVSFNDDVRNSINGITISPKKNFCIIKIWMNNCKYQDPNIMDDIPYLSPKGCMFKKQVPEY
jgi:hypothetical protein